MGTIKQLRWWAYKILPLAYDDSLSYYEAMDKCVNKVNELVGAVNELPNNVSEEIKKQLNGDGNIYNNLFSGLVNAIATKESDSVTYTPNNKQGGEIIWLGNTLYEVVDEMKVGTNYIIGTNIVPVNIDSELMRIKNFISTHNEYYHTRAVANHEAQSYLYWKNNLYRVDTDIKIDEIISERVTSNGVTTGQLTPVNVMDEITNHYIEMHESDNNLQTQIDGNDGDIEVINNNVANINHKIDDTNTRISNIVAQSGNDNTEIVDGRKGILDFDKMSFETIGDAIRAQSEYASEWRTYESIRKTIGTWNLIDPNTLIKGERVNSDGTFAKNANYSRTNYIDIEGKTELSALNSGAAAFYDSSYTFISYSNGFNNTSVPTNAKYAVVAYPFADVNKINLTDGTKYTLKYITDDDIGNLYRMLYLRTDYSISSNTITFSNNTVLFNSYTSSGLIYRPSTDFSIDVLPGFVLYVKFKFYTEGYTTVTENPFATIQSSSFTYDLGTVIAFNDGDGIEFCINTRKFNTPVNMITRFSVNINSHQLPTGTSDTYLDNDSTEPSNCGILTAKNYSDSGKPTKLLMVCHGAGKGLFQSNDNSSWNKDSHYINMLNMFAEAGYTCFDCTGYANTSNGYNFWGSPNGVQAWRKAYDYVVKNYNVEHEFSIYGFSMGGLTALELGRTMYPNIKCIALGSPVINLEYYCKHDAGALAATRAAYGFSGEYNSDYTVGCDTSKGIVEFNNTLYCVDKYPPIRMWYGSTEIGGNVEANTSDNLITAVHNSNGIISKRIVDGRGHEICYGGDENIIREYIDFINRYNYY